MASRALSGPGIVAESSPCRVRRASLCRNTWGVKSGHKYVQCGLLALQSVTALGRRCFWRHFSRLKGGGDGRASQGRRRSVFRATACAARNFLRANTISWMMSFPVKCSSVWAFPSSSVIQSTKSRRETKATADEYSADQQDEVKVYPA